MLMLLLLMSPFVVGALAGCETSAEIGEPAEIAGVDVGGTLEVTAMLDKKAYQVAGWILVALLGVIAIIAAARGNWTNALFIAIFFIAAALFVALRNQLPSLFSLLFALAAVIDGFGWAFNLWDRITAYDPVSHAFTTFAGALAVGFLIFHSVRIHFRGHGVAFAATIAAWGLALGGLWEIFEWTMGVAQTYQSVVVDLMMDALGAVLAGLLAVWAVRKQPPAQLHA